MYQFFYQWFLEVFWREACLIFFIKAFKIFLWHVEKKSRLFFIFFYVSHEKKNNKSLNQNSETRFPASECFQPLGEIWCTNS